MTSCKYASAPNQLFERSNITGAWIEKKDAPRDMCSWAHYHPDALEKLTNVPPWLVRNSLSGHLMNPADCEVCPLFDPGDALE